MARVDTAPVMADHEAARILLSVSPGFLAPPPPPSSTFYSRQRDRGWSLESLETLCDLAARELPVSVSSDSGSDIDESEVDDHPAPLSSSTGHGVSGASAAAPDSVRQLRNRPRTMSESAVQSRATSAYLSAATAGAIGHALSPELQAVYNSSGRIGIYTPEERAAIIKRFHEKRLRRVWAKRIRYSCRKNLADRRVRVKGRFVKAEELAAMNAAAGSGGPAGPAGAAGPAAGASGAAGTPVSVSAAAAAAAASVVGGAAAGPATAHGGRWQPPVAPKVEGASEGAASAALAAAQKALKAQRPPRVPLRRPRSMSMPDI